MMFFILLVFCCGAKGEFITTGLDTSLGSDYLKKIIGPIDKNYNEGSSRISKIAQKLGLGRDDEEAVLNEDNFVRPCPSYDLNCIRKFFADNSNCEPVCDPIPDSLYLLQNTLYYPSINISITLTDVKIKGLNNYDIVEFFYNKKTRKLIFALEIKYLNETTQNGCFSYKRSARESIVLCDFITVHFRKPIYTAEIPIIPNLRLDLADIHAYNSETNADYSIGPQAYTSKDPEVIKTFKEVASNFPMIIQESCLFQPNLLMAYIIQKNICDFGVKLYSL